MSRILVRIRCLGNFLAHGIRTVGIDSNIEHLIKIRWKHYVECQSFYFIHPFLDPDRIGYDIFDDLPEETDKSQKISDKCMQENCPNIITSEKTAKIPKRKLPVRRKSKQRDETDAKLDETDQAHDSIAGDSDTELFEIEESDGPLIPLYHLREEGTTKWVLLSDLCYILKIKSKDTLMKMVRLHRHNLFPFFFCFFFFGNTFNHDFHSI